MEWVVNTSPQQLCPLERTPVPYEQEARRPPEPVPTIWEREKSLTSSGIRTPNPPTRNLVNIPTKLSRLLRTFTSRQSSNSLKLLQDINSYFDRQNLWLRWRCHWNGMQHECWDRKYIIMFVEKPPMKKTANLLVGGKIILKYIFDKYCWSEFGLVIGSRLLTISGHSINGIQLRES